MDYYKLKVLNNKKKILIILLVIFIIGGLSFYYFCFYKKETRETILFESHDLEEKKENDIIISNDTLWVDIKGYVMKPGVYSFKKDDDARINDLILKAGGLQKNADTSIINLSKKLDDEMSVIIYSKSEVENFLATKDKLKNELEICEEKLKNNACITKNDEVTNNLININNASKEELMSLQGIGESKALNIINYRNKTPFKSIDDLKNVEGIGESLFETIKNNITI